MGKTDVKDKAESGATEEQVEADETHSKKRKHGRYVPYRTTQAGLLVDRHVVVRAAGGRAQLGRQLLKLAEGSNHHRAKAMHV